MPNLDEEQLYLAKIEESNLSGVHNLIVSKTELDLFYVQTSHHKRFKSFFYGFKTAPYSEYTEVLNVTHYEPNLLVESIYQIHIPSINLYQKISNMDVLIEIIDAGLDCYIEVTDSKQRFIQRTKQLMGKSR